MTSRISSSFEQIFLAMPLPIQIATCDEYELAPLFVSLFKGNQPVLEAGCGSGRWNAWFDKQGIISAGLDWSDELCKRAEREIPKCRFVTGDMQDMPFEDGEFGGLIALGSVEHMPHGPTTALRECHRVLRSGGIAVITVPYGGWLRRTRLMLLGPLTQLKANALLRRILRKKGWNGRRLNVAKRGTTAEWYPVFACDETGYFFYEYEFNKKQMRGFLTETGFEIVREFVAFGNEGILHNCGRLAGSWNSVTADVDFTFLGKVLRTILPVDIVGHMLCYVVKKH
jgi:ubiquinone/menaquinone biosynthesis C-methylase UbiE